MNRNDGIPFNGFDSVLEMLRHADANFRKKILGNLRQRDPHLARRLEEELGAWMQVTEDSRDTLERSQRTAQTRNYGH